MKPFKHPRLDAKLSLVAAIEPRCCLVAPFIVRNADFCCCPNVVARFAFATATDGFGVRVARFQDADPRASAMRALHQKSEIGGGRVE